MTEFLYSIAEATLAEVNRQVSALCSALADTAAEDREIAAGAA